MLYFRKCLLLWIVLWSGAFLHAGTYRGVDFACTAIPQANINGVTLASKIHIATTNISSEKLFTRFHVVVTSSQGRVKDFGELGKGNFVPQAMETYDFTPFEKASVQDEFPKTCKFTQIQVCPANPPAGFQGTYYRPFIDGGKECKAVANIMIALAVPKPKGSGCTAITKTWAMTEGYGHHYVYAVGTAATDLDSAVAHAVTPSNDPEQSAVVMVKGCGPGHGAVAASLKHGSCSGDVCPIIAEGVYEEMAGALGDSKETAEKEALSNCHNTDLYKRVPSLDGCQIVKSW